jgi:hypothetical protein
MNGTTGTSKLDTDGGEGGLDPRTAAQLLERTQRRAERGLSFRTPKLSLIAAAAMLVAFGSVWLSVRNQHPYRGPTPGSLVVLYVFVAIRIVSVLVAQRRAAAGVSGRTVRRHRAEAVGLAAALIAVYVGMAGLAHAGASDGVVYGLYVVTVTLLVLGAFGAARAAVREDWTQLGGAVGILLVAAGSAFAGPRGVWLSNGIGLCAVFVGVSAAQARQRRASASGA